MFREVLIRRGAVLLCMRFLDWVWEWLFPDPIIPTVVAKGVLDGCLNAASETYPNEFVALLVAEHSSEVEFKRPRERVYDSYIITSYYVLPGTENTPTSAAIKNVNIPVSARIVGSFHSHPSGNVQPSAEDSSLFRRYPINIIAGYPYTFDSLGVYGPDSSRINIDFVEVVDSEVDARWFDGL